MATDSTLPPVYITKNGSFLGSLDGPRIDLYMNEDTSSPSPVVQTEKPKTRFLNRYESFSKSDYEATRRSRPSNNPPEYEVNVEAPNRYRRRKDLLRYDWPCKLQCCSRG